MSDPRTPCILYYRRRERERRASHFAEKQQMTAEDALREQGYEIICRYGDDEFADPFLGHLEPRPAWELALQAAERHAVGRPDRRCTVIILRVDGIGSGDPFLPSRQDVSKYPGLQFRVCGFSLRKHALDTPLQSAQRYRQRFIEMDRKTYVGDVISLGRSQRRAEVTLRPDPHKQVTRAYYTNPSDVPLSIRLQRYRSPVAGSASWPCLVEREDITIPPKTARYLSSFVQGDPDLSNEWWEVRVGEKRETQVGKCLITPEKLSMDWLSMVWWHYTPKELSADDFLWEHAPTIETRRLQFRNWKRDDTKPYAAALNNPQVMHFLGGVQSIDEIEDDLEYFRREGEAGPTFWAVETKR